MDAAAAYLRERAELPTNCAPDEADRLLFARLLAGLSAPIGRLHPYVAVGRERMRMLDRGTQLMIGFHDGVADTTRIDAVKYIPVWTAGLNARVRPNVSAFLEYSRHRDDYLRQYTGDSWDIAIGVGRKLS